MIKEKAIFLRYGAAVPSAFRSNPDNKPKHAGKAGVADDDQKAEDQQGQSRLLKRYHGVWSYRQAEVVDSGRRSEDGPVDVSRTAAKRFM